MYEKKKIEKIILSARIFSFSYSVVGENVYYTREPRKILLCQYRWPKMTLAGGAQTVLGNDK